MVLTALALVCTAGRADEPAKTAEPDGDLLEFLGTVDSASEPAARPDDDSWLDYLSQADIDAAAKKARKSDPPRRADPDRQAAPPQSDTAPRADPSPGASKVKPDDQ